MSERFTVKRARVEITIEYSLDKREEFPFQPRRGPAAVAGTAGVDIVDGEIHRIHVWGYRLRADGSLGRNLAHVTYYPERGNGDMADAPEWVRDLVSRVVIPAVDWLPERKV